ncbi:MAG: VWA domain-containing protein, partial [Anaerolineae bacterium]|nr:VWA domain-containing protein [Phycisphaerae bacterium]
MNRLLEILLGLNRGFLSRDGDLSLTFNPSWPWQATIGAGAWNFLLVLLVIGLVVVIYRREGRSRPVRITLGVIRGALLALVIALLNRPVLTLGQSYTEPSVVAVLIDDSLSMRIRDANPDPKAEAQSRLASAVNLLTGEDQKLIKDLGKVHQLRYYKFDSTASPITPSTQPSATANPIVDALNALEPTGQSTQLGASLRAVSDDLQGQRVAGVILLTDGRDTPQRPLAATLAMLKDTGVKVFPVPMGSDQPPANIEVQSIVSQDAAFKDDIVNVKATVRATGVGASRNVVVRLKDKKTDRAMIGADGRMVEQQVTLPNDQPTEVELQFKPEQIGQLDLVVEAIKQPGEIDDDDNVRELQIEVLDAKIAVLYVEGYPRWEYRYLKNEMIRDRTVDIACWLTSADPTFKQEGDIPITRFPENMDEMLAYDVVVFGDVDPDYFSDAQLQLVADFVSKKSGGFGLVAGPQSAPQRYRGTPIETILPVDISRVQDDDPRGGALTQGFRIQLTKEGENSSIFRFFADKQRNDKYLREDLQQLFWYCHGVRVKRGVGEVLAEHPV